MKRIIVLIALVAAMAALAVAPVGAKGKKGKAAMKVEQKIHDFGVIKEDAGSVTCEFPFVNAGEGNLIIYDATAECGCTRPDYQKNPVAPGKTGKIKVTYNPIGRPGAFEKTVTVKTNGQPSKIRLKIKGNVTPKK